MTMPPIAGGKRTRRLPASTSVARAIDPSLRQPKDGPK
jgi:hypothetical protein